MRFLRKLLSTVQKMLRHSHHCGCGRWRAAVCLLLLWQFLAAHDSYRRAEAGLPGDSLSTPAAPAFSKEAEDRAVAQVLAMRDLRWRIENYLWIRDLTGAERPIGQLKRGQVKLHNLWNWCIDNNQLARFIVAKDRKVGVSTYVQARTFVSVIDHGYQALTVAHDRPSAGYLVDMSVLFYEHYSLAKPEMLKKNESGIRFKSGGIEIHTANRTESTRSRTPQIIAGSEVAHWVHGNKASISIQQAIGKVPNTVLIYESTANSFDPLFQPTWENACENCVVTFDDELNPTVTVKDQTTVSNPMRRWNGFIPLFLSVMENEDKRIAFSSAEQRIAFLGSLNEDEKRLMSEFGALPEFLNYRRRTIAEECRGRIEVFNQEHPVTPHVMFIQTGNPRFNQEALDGMSIEDGEKGVLLRDEKSWARPLRFRPDSAACLTVFRPPVPNHRYIAGTDMATGIVDDKKDPDASVTQIFDLDTPWIEQVAVIRGQLNSEEMYPILFHAAEWYNFAYLVTETSYAEYLITRLSQTYPPELMYRRAGGEVGFHTHAGTRSLLIDTAAALLDTRKLMLHDLTTIRQFRSLKKGHRNTVLKDIHDDDVFAAALAFIGIDSYPQRAWTPKQAFTRGRFDSNAISKPKMVGYGDADDY